VTLSSITHVAPLAQRTHILVGDRGLQRLSQTHLLLAGLGGVGSYAAEALVRAGIGRLTLADHDVVADSNLNRQLPALHSTIGEKKLQVMAQRLRDINPAVELTLLDRFLSAEEMPTLLTTGFDFAIDAIDSLNSKVALLIGALEAGVPIASSMGAGGRLDPSQLVLGDVMDSTICPLARQIRKRLRRRGIGRGVLAVWSTEAARPPLPPEATDRGRPRAVNGTISYMPALFGLTLAGAVLHRLLQPVISDRVESERL